MDLSRVKRVIGAEATEALNDVYVAVVGLGGVGGYVAEALCRSGVGHLLLIDADVVTSSNINRQIIALLSTQGQNKTEVMAARLHDINPNCQISVNSCFYQPGDFDKFFVDRPDFIADAIDSVPSKTDLILHALERKIPIVSAMGTGNKLCPELLTLCDISKTEICPFAKRIRKNLRQNGVDKGLMVVTSKEAPQRTEEGSVPGSMIFVPATAGLLMASYIVRELLRKQGIKQHDD